MPLKLNVGLSKKVGLPDFGSRGASCNVEVKLDSGLLTSDPEAFRTAVRRVYNVCAEAINEELARQQGQDPVAAHEPHAVQGGTVQAATDASNGHRNGNGANGHRATQKQLDYAGQLAGQIRGLGVRKLENLASKMFAKPLADLTSLEASGLIDTLKAIKEGSIDLQAALKGAAA